MQRTDEEKRNLCEQILDRVSDGEPLAAVCRELKLPVSTWYAWCEADTELAGRIARAREAGFDVIATDCQRIADEPPPSTDTGATDSGYVQWQKNRIWTRLQLLAKWDPKRYGERMQVDANVSTTVDIRDFTGRKNG
jgi:hypothetical protein